MLRRVVVRQFRQCEFPDRGHPHECAAGGEQTLADEFTAGHLRRGFGLAILQIGHVVLHKDDVPGGLLVIPFILNHITKNSLTK